MVSQTSPHTPIALVALDLDGTLMGENLIISSRVRETVAAIQQRGIITTLATGRMHAATLPFAEILGVQAPMICYQGGWIQAPQGAILHRTILPQVLAKSAIALGHTHNWHTVLYADGMIHIEALRYPPSFYEQLLGPNAVINPDLNAVLEEHKADKILYVAEPDAISFMAQILTPFFNSTAEVVQSHRMFIEVVPKSVNKGSALAWLAAYYGIPQQEVLAIGDQENDVSMLSWAGVGIAMGNAVAAAKNSADWIAPALDCDGAAVALEHFVLQGSLH